MTLSDLQAFLVSSGCNKHEAVITLIQACLDEGPKAGTDLRNTLAGLGYHREHVRKVLATNAGSSPKLNPWQRLDGGLYRLHT